MFKSQKALFLTKGSIRYGQSIILSRLLQRKMSPLLQSKSLQNLNIRLLPSLIIRLAQIQSFTVRPFYGRVSVDQIMQACHWKAHNTFTNFYLKDLTWSDNDNNMYLGPVVAAQQVLVPSPQHTHLRKEKKGGAHPVPPSLQESIPGSRYWLPLQMFTVRSVIYPYFLTV